jgi:hypothetical protein
MKVVLSPDMENLKGKRIAILATARIEQPVLPHPRRALAGRGPENNSGAASEDRD